MRPVNLIPADERRGHASPLRTGPTPYVVVGALVGALIGVTLLVLAGNQISDRKSELAQVKREDAVASAKAQRLSAYAEYAALREQRVATVKSLADSRFDWERVMRELSLILPPDVSLTELTATASSAVSVGGGEASGGAGGDLRSGIAGPALELNGCAAGQPGVAGFVTALKDIDGVTRVGVESSALPPTGTAAGTGEGGGTTCQTANFVAEFRIVVAFDAAPVAPAEGESLIAPSPESGEAPSTESTEGGEEPSAPPAEG